MQISRLLPKFGFERKFSNLLNVSVHFGYAADFLKKYIFWHEFISQMGHRDYRHNQFFKGFNMSVFADVENVVF